MTTAMIVVMLMVTMVPLMRLVVRMTQTAAALLHGCSCSSTVDGINPALPTIRTHMLGSLGHAQDIYIINSITPHSLRKSRSFHIYSRFDCNTQH